jgi:hypothetical protein
MFFALDGKEPEKHNGLRHPSQSTKPCGRKVDHAAEKSDRDEARRILLSLVLGYSLAARASITLLGHD